MKKPVECRPGCQCKKGYSKWIDHMLIFFIFNLFFFFTIKMAYVSRQTFSLFVICIFYFSFVAPNQFSIRPVKPVSNQANVLVITPDRVTVKTTGSRKTATLGLLSFYSFTCRFPKSYLFYFIFALVRFLFAVRVTLANGNAPKINAQGCVRTGANHTTRHSTVYRESCCPNSYDMPLSFLLFLRGFSDRRRYFVNDPNVLLFLQANSTISMGIAIT